VAGQQVLTLLDEQSLMSTPRTSQTSELDLTVEPSAGVADCAPPAIPEDADP
jgi:hypothetical protein